MRVAVVFLAILAAANAHPIRRQASVMSYDDMHGYTPVSDVTEIAKIDEDQQRILNAVGESPVNFAEAKRLYTTGPLQALSTGLGDMAEANAIQMKTDGRSVIQTYASYWDANKINGDPSVTCKAGTVLNGCPNYADVMVMAALNGAGDYAYTTPGDRDAARAQIAKKGTAYHAAWMYSIAQLSAAISKADGFTNSTKKMADGSTAESVVGHHIDRAWAYYTGSQNAVMPLSLAKARGVNFGTCSAVPDAILAEFNAMQAAAMTDTFDKKEIDTRGRNLVPLMTIPMIQGCIRYASIADGLVMDLETANVTRLEALAETWIFCAGVIPQLLPADQRTVRNMVDPAKKATIVKGDIIAALENNYNRMGVTPAQVGVFNPDGACAEASSASGVSASLMLSLAAALLAVVGVRGA